MERFLSMSFIIPILYIVIDYHQQQSLTSSPSIINPIEGNSIPFGVFSIYNDNLLNEVLEMYMKIVIRTPFNQLSVCGIPKIVMILATPKI